MLLIFPSVFSFLQLGSAMVFSVNDSQYIKMPPLYSLDDYDRCMTDIEGIYCIVDMNIFSRTNSTLMQFIKEYSENKKKHFNYTQLHRGICVNRTCQKFLYDEYNKTEDLKVILEECLNESLWRDYELEARLSTIYYCKKSNETISPDLTDIIVAAIYLIILVLNLIGSFYDVLQSRGGKKGNSYLLAFSLRQNWNRLRASSSEEADRLKVFQGARTVLMVCFICSHTFLDIFHLYVANPQSLEKSYENPFNFVVINGMIATSIFFVMSSFLLAYNFQLSIEKTGVQWTQIPMGIIFRWLRLTPVYAFVLATVATWMRHLGNAPLWDYTVTSESNACREYWWMHLLYINNFVYRNDKCLIQTWYIAADIQLFCLGLIICVVVRTARARKIFLSVLMVIALLIVALVTYIMDLDGTVLQYPESFRHFYDNDETLLNVYVLPHTNLSSLVIGLAGGFLTFHWQKTKKDITTMKKFSWVFVLNLPLCVLLIMSGAVFYIDGYPPSAALNILYATLCKPLFQTLSVILFVSCIFKIENIWRRILEWKGFSWTGKITYSMFLVHTCIIRALVGSQEQPLHISAATGLLYVNASIVLSCFFATILYLFVEAPSNGLIKALLKPASKKKEDTVSDKRNTVEVSTIRVSNEDDNKRTTELATVL